MTDTKRCTKCGFEKRLSEFNSHPSTKDNCSSWCKQCTRSAAKESSKKLKKERIDAIFKWYEDVLNIVGE